MRRWLEFSVAGETCAATIDEGAHHHGLFIVSGGNDIRCGAHRGMAELAATVAAQGHPVLRFDRRGIGDSTGENAGFDSSGPDIIAALALFRATCPRMTRITAFGNCDAATAVALYCPSAGAQAVVLANPWTIDGTATDDGSPSSPASLAAQVPPAAVIRARYLDKLRRPAEWRRFFTGGVSIGKLVQGLRAAGSLGKPEPSILARRLALALEQSTSKITILLAEQDGTALAFSAAWLTPEFNAARQKIAVASFPTASHSFAGADARRWLIERIITALDD